MLLKLTKYPRPEQTDMVCHTAHGSREFKLGAATEVPNEEASAILAGPFGGCFEAVGTAPAASAPPTEDKSAAPAAAAGKGYQTK